MTSRLLPRARRLLLTTGALAAGSTAASVAMTDDNDPTFLLRATTRSLRTVSAGVQIVADYKWTLRSSATSLLDKDAYRALKSQVHQRSAEKLLRAIEKSGGVYVKLGQHISALEYLLPVEYVRTMAVFSEFDPKPLGVASLAQVHRARLKDGREVAIKCQHPSVRKFSMLDIELTAGFVRLVRWAFKEFEFGWLADEMRDNLPLELDFKHEAANANRVRYNFAHSGRKVHVPEVYWAEHRLLCMEFCPGNRIDDLEYLQKHNINPTQVACELTRVFTEMIFKHGFLHADPHPGNLLIHPVTPRAYPLPLVSWFLPRRRNFEIVLLDHGLYRTLSRDFTHGYARLWRALIRSDEPQIRHWSKRVANVDMYELFACMLTGGVRAARSENELDDVAQNAGFYFTEIAGVLAQVPRPLLLVFKTNDLLRAVSRGLGLSEWASVSVMSAGVLDLFARGGEQGDEEDEPEEKEGVVARWKHRLESWAVHAAVWMYENGWM
ncbi:ABC1 family-domain-containing protein [Catenaria anguillulae PL171]|uniref:ABC1 family-domain-containing protein n=1 Tax=Catenaria anguillulae PL171 TaxID=765915 RepID=A0A1Y2HUT9_9FUNG|nr:ABC1 family-domain-containing protein [Catenaria anguillulae PL171]